MSRKRDSEIRARLFRDAGGRCFWCGCATVFEKRGAFQPKNFATLDHLYSRLDPKRKEPAVRGQRRWVLACYACNQARNNGEQSALPKEELWKRSGRAAPSSGETTEP